MWLCWYSDVLSQHDHINRYDHQDHLPSGTLSPSFSVASAELLFLQNTPGTFPRPRRRWLPDETTVQSSLPKTSSLQVGLLGADGAAETIHFTWFHIVRSRSHRHCFTWKETRKLMHLIHYNMWQHQVHRIAEMLVKMPIFSPMQKRSAATGAEDASNLTEISWIATWYDMNIEFFCAGLTCCWWWTRAPRALLIWFCAPLRPTSHLWVETVQSHAPIARRQRCLKGATATKAVAKFTDGTMYSMINITCNIECERERETGTGWDRDMDRLD